ncbi:MAG TPA: hypothetical protein VES69_14020 [Pyrinomonadaceae bacterium]|nr:hypothetical protein [Pyrinomonadaceae bacterium]
MQARNYSHFISPVEAGTLPIANSSALPIANCQLQIGVKRQPDRNGKPAVETQINLAAVDWNVKVYLCRKGPKSAIGNWQLEIIRIGNRQ